MLPKRTFISLAFLSLFLFSAMQTTTTRTLYTWKTDYKEQSALKNSLKAPAQTQRISLPENSFGHWLRHIPVKSLGGTVMLYNGKPKGNQQAHAAILDIDVGTKDLQQCADAVMRLRAEYQFAMSKFEEISFTFTNGDVCAYSKWMQGFRPSVNNNKVSWNKSAEAGNSYKIFRQYMDMVFNYAGTASLEKELKKQVLNEIMPGDVFIKGGHPGHAVIVMDVAINEKKEKFFLLAQSYMPAQEIHILKNPNNTSLSPWYSLKELNGKLNTPEWIFETGQLKKF